MYLGIYSISGILDRLSPEPHYTHFCHARTHYIQTFFQTFNCFNCSSEHPTVLQMCWASGHVPRKVFNFQCITVYLKISLRIR